jgi:type IV fimbrial biogenesis protein FimT
MVEMMITLVLLAVLAGIAAPSMSQFIRASRLNSAANQFQADVQMARREAIRRNTRVLVCPLEADGSTSGKCGTDFTKWATWGWLVCYDAVGASATDPPDGVCDDTAADNPNPIRTHAALDSSLKLLTVSVASGTCSTTESALTAPMQFNADGSVTDTPAAPTYFLVTGTWSGAKNYCATIAPSGNIGLVKPAP